MYYSPTDLTMLSRYWIWFLILGIVLAGLGIIAISVSTLATLLTVIFLGSVLVVGGILIIVDAFKFLYKKSGFILHILWGILYLIVGVMMIKSPMLGSISLTLILGIFYVFIGMSRITYSLSVKFPDWGWTFFNGIIAFLLGLLILSDWPAASLFIIGLFIGIDLFFAGLAYIMLALSAKELVAIPTKVKKVR